MKQAPLPPPPPPLLPKSPPLPLLTQSTKLDIKSSTCYDKLDSFDESIVKNEIQDFITRILPTLPKNEDKGEEEEALNLVVYSHLQPILQQGPVCGIVALAMAGDVLNRNASNLGTNSDIILQEAIKLNITRKGEMFSANGMVELANKVFPYYDAVLMDNRGQTSSSIMKQILSTIIEGGVLLVPYDADFNHSPSLRRGHGAHWAVLHGILLSQVVFTHDTKTTIIEEQQSYPSSTLQSLVPKNNEKFNKSKEGEQHNSDTKNMTNILKPEEMTKELKSKLLASNNIEGHYTYFAICHQGKSKHSGIWDLTDLIKSNENLSEVSPKIVENQEIDPLVIFDMKQFLSYKMIIIQRKPSSS